MLGDAAAARSAVVGPVKEPEEVAEMVVDAIDAERFLILTDPITWVVLAIAAAALVRAPRTAERSG